MEEKNDALFHLESAQAYLDEITRMLWYVYEDYYEMQNSDLYTKANNYERLRPFIYNTHTLLLNLSDEMKKQVDECYEERKKAKHE